VFSKKRKSQVSEVVGEFQTKGEFGNTSLAERRLPEIRGSFHHTAIN